MNVASRMESNGEPMHITLSESSFQLVQDNYNFERREVNLKGKGMCSAFVLVSRKTIQLDTGDV